MEEVKEQLDLKHLEDDFEHIAKRAANGDDDIFNNIAALYRLGEFEYKKQNQHRLVANPAHVCTSACNLTPVNVVVYRYVERSGGWYTERNISLHLCLVDTCEHIDPRHRCEEQTYGMCPHMHRYIPQDIRKLKDFWVCNTTGNVHMCGELCTRSTIIHESEGNYVCALTGQVTDKHVVPVEYYQNQQLLLAAGNEEPITMENGLGNALQKKGYQKLLTRQKVPSQTPVWDRHGDILLYHACVVAVCEQLFFSEERQMMEADNYLQAYERAYEEVVKSLRVRKMMDGGVNSALARFSKRLLAAQALLGDAAQLHLHHKQFVHTIKVPAVLAMYQFKSPTNTYFHNVPMMHTVNIYMRDRLKVIDTKYASIGGANRLANSLIAPQMQPILKMRREEMLNECEGIRRRRDELLRHAIEDYRARHSIEPRKITKWDSPEWQTRMKNIKDIFSHCLVRIWVTMTRYNALSECGEGVNLSFKRCLLALLYMTRKTMSISDSDAPSGASEMVTVIPKIDFAMLLPPENQLDRFNLMPYSNSALSRKLTTTQTEIKNCMYSISHKGYLSNLQLRMIDVYAEIVEKKVAKS